MNFFDIHRHDEFSLFDGMGKAKQVAEYAKELGYPAVGSTNHGNISGLIKHFNACSENDLIPILGCEFYFQPKINHEKGYYHLCIFAKNMKGWENLNKLITISNQEENYYYKPKISFQNLKDNSEGLICSTACIGGYIPQLLLKEKYDRADKATEYFKGIFGKNFFLEIQPIEIPGKGKGQENDQIKLNERLLFLGRKDNIPVIATTDSHFVKKDDFPTYLKMHEMKKSELGKSYVERYMPTQEEMKERIKKYHSKYEDDISDGMDIFLGRVGDSRKWFSFEPNMPSYREDPEETYQLMKQKCIKKL